MLSVLFHHYFLHRDISCEIWQLQTAACGLQTCPTSTNAMFGFQLLTPNEGSNAEVGQLIAKLSNWLQVQSLEAF